MPEAFKAGSPIAIIAELWRYPVKSMRGESMSSLEITPDGIAGDRRFAIQSSGAPQGKPLLTGRERAGMLLYTARTVEGFVRVRTPNGLDFGLHDPALLKEMATAFADGHALHVLPSSSPLTDCRPIALLSQEAVARLGMELGQAVDARRFRANIVLAFPERAPSTAIADPEDGTIFPEDALVGRHVHFSEAEVRVTERDPRCRIVILDPETAAAEPAIMKLIDRRHGGRVGVYAVPVKPGMVRVGDVVRLAP